MTEGESDRGRERLRQDAMTVFRAGIAAVDPLDVVSRWLWVDAGTLVMGPGEHPVESAQLEDVGRILVVGAGKAAADMARAVERVLHDRVFDGVVAVPHGSKVSLERIRVYPAGHPMPDEDGVRASEEVARLVAGAGSEDLVIALFSGGGSALLPSPVPGVGLADKQEVTALLLRSGASITELNTVRKHLSVLKGGGLARIAAPARVIALIISDVVGDDPGTIASGPTAPDATTLKDAVDILQKRKVWDNTPLQVQRRLLDASQDHETPKPGDPIFSRVRNHIVAGNQNALAGMRLCAEELGYHVAQLPEAVVGEARNAAQTYIERCTLLMHQEPTRPLCILSGGETTVTVRGNGLGGRNQEFCLAAASAMEGWEGSLLCSAGTDGIDGPTQAAGAVVDGTTLARARSKNMSQMDSLARNDSTNFFSALGDLIVTGATGTNVMDVQILMITGHR